MAEFIDVALPEGLSFEETEELKEALRGIEGVNLPNTRSLDLATLSMGVGLVTQLLPVVQTIAGFTQKKKVGGAKITLANGTVIEATDMTMEDLQTLVAAGS